MCAEVKGGTNLKTNRRSIAVGGLLVAVLLGVGLLWNDSYAQTPIQPAGPASGYRTIVVSGSGQASGRPDNAIVTLGVQTDAETAAQALAQNNQQMQSVIQTVQQAGVAPDDIQTQAVQLVPRQSTEQPPAPSGQGGQTSIVGYTATNNVQVRVRALDQLGQLLDSVVRAGANQVQGIGFVISDPSRLREQAQQAAWQDAREQAARLASLAGASLGQVLSITQTGSPPIPYPAVAAAANAAVPIAPGTQEVQVTIQVTWELSDQPVDNGGNGAQGTSTSTPTPFVLASPTAIGTTTTPEPAATSVLTATGSISLPTTIVGQATASPSASATSGVAGGISSPTPFPAGQGTATPAVGAVPPVTGWETMTIPELGLTFDMPQGWQKQGAEWTWAAPGPGAPRLGIDWQDVTPGWQPDQLLPPGAVILSREAGLVGGVLRATRFVIQAPVDQSDPSAMPFQTHLVIQVDTRAYDAFAMARSQKELNELDNLLLHVIGSVTFSNGSA